MPPWSRAARPTFLHYISAVFYESVEVKGENSCTFGVGRHHGSHSGPKYGRATVAYFPEESPGAPFINREETRQESHQEFVASSRTRRWPGIISPVLAGRTHSETSWAHRKTLRSPVRSPAGSPIEKSSTARNTGGRRVIHFFGEGSFQKNTGENSWRSVRLLVQWWQRSDAPRRLQRRQEPSCC